MVDLEALLIEAEVIIHGMMQDPEEYKTVQRAREFLDRRRSRREAVFREERERQQVFPFKLADRVFEVPAETFRDGGPWPEPR